MNPFLKLFKGGLVAIILVVFSHTMFSQETEILKIKQEISKKGIKRFIKELDNSPIQLKLEKIKLLGKVKNRELVIPMISKFLNQKSQAENIRIATVIALGEMGYLQMKMRLLAVLMKEKNSDVRIEIIRVLGKYVNKTYMPYFIELLKDPDPRIQIAARKAIVLIGKSAVYPLTSKYNSSKNTTVRKHIVIALGDLGKLNTFALLLSALTDQDIGIRKEAALAVGKKDSKLGRELLISIYGILKNEGQKKFLEEAVMIIGKPMVQPILQLMLTNEESSVRDDALMLLKRLGKNATEGMIELLRDESKDVRKMAANGLDKMQWEPSSEEEKATYLIALEKWEEVKSLGEASVDPLIAAIECNDPVIKRKIIILLGESASPKIVAPLVKIINSRNQIDRDMKRSAKAYIVKAKNPTDVDALVSLALIYANEVGHREIIAWAMERLYVLKDRRAIPVYRSNRSTKSALILLELGEVEELMMGVENVRSAKFNAVKNLGSIKDARMVEPIVTHFLNDLSEDKQVRYQAAVALGKIGDESAVQPLIDILINDKEPMVKSASARALGEIKSKSAVEALITALQNDPDRGTRTGAAIALGMIKDESSLDALIAAQKNDSENVVTYNAGLALLEMKHPKAIDFYISVLSFNNIEMRSEAAAILQQMNHAKAQKAMPAVQKVIRDDAYITEIATYDVLGRVDFVELRNVKGDKVALKKYFYNNRYMAMQITEVLMTDPATGNELLKIDYEEGKPKVSKWICINRKGNIIKRSGKVILVNTFRAQQESKYNISYNGNVKAKMVTKIFICKNCIANTKLSDCLYVW